MAEKARLEQEALERRVAALEAALADTQKPRRAKSKPAHPATKADTGEN